MILRSFLMIVFLGLVMFFSPASYAQQVVEGFKVEMPKLKEVELDVFNKTSTLYKRMPFGDEYLAYSVRLPKNWSKQANEGGEDFRLSNKVLGEIDRYYAPVRMGERSYLSVKAVELDHKLTAEQWFLLYMLENSYTLQGMPVVDDNRVEVLYVVVNRGVTYIAMAAAQISGKRVVFSQYVMPSDVWDAEQGYATRVMESFQLDKLDDAPVEEKVQYQFLDVAEMSYPVSWDIRTRPLRSLDKLSARLLNVKKKTGFGGARYLNGQIDVHLINEFIVDDIEDDIENFKSEISADNLVIGDALETLEGFEVHESITPISAMVYKATDKARSLLGYEFWLSVVQSGEYYYFVSLLTPARDADYASWARNIETFKELNQNIETFYDE